MAATQANIEVGRRKTATARVRIINGSGKLTINKKDAIDYLKSQDMLKDVMAPLKVTDSVGIYDIFIGVKGGGVKGQIGAMILGISRNLIKINPELKPKLKEFGFMTRDPRMVERKKYGRPKARKRFQFSKR